ncbi:metal-dependent transcriptional regulator [Herbiconiux moechotypicola]|uniref:Manganese transport regulator n=1 Tax=Herbiconiux moechotypicola TaxID=637393 RepID=A0ABP5Q3R0_9MICO|nr:metal-dependent transcriptional regulator [Herbiconiux moechotypicola]MCS5729092.1 metal-dependent transcriptional regulator [Herbiconiux moechotypicola]
MPEPETATENYLKTIYAHTEWQPDPITPSALAARLGVAPSSVTEMVKKLAAAGYLSHVPYGPLTLTAAGRMRAMGVVRRHRLIETWLVQEMGYGWHEVHDEAEVLEHALSDRLLDAIDARLGRPAQDPHGDPIPAADGTVPVFDAVVLQDARPGHEGTVVRISDRDPSLLESLAAHGIGPGTRVRVEPTDPDAAPGATLIPLPAAIAAPAGVSLTPDATDSIWLTA